MSKVTLGGKRLHAGEGMSVEMHPYSGSKHNLSHRVRLSMAPGVLQPVLTEIMTPGDKFNLNFNTAVRTYPTVGPLFGKYKVAIDVFSTRLSLYNKQLHNNRTNLARTMDTVYFPTMTLIGPNPTSESQPVSAAIKRNRSQISASSLLSHLELNGLGSISSTDGVEGEVPATITDTYQAMAVLNYYEIGKEYFCNKQERDAYVMGSGLEAEETALIRQYRIGQSTIISIAAAQTLPGNGTLSNVTSTWRVDGLGLLNYADGNLNTNGIVFQYSGSSSTAPENRYNATYDPSINGWKLTQTGHVITIGSYQTGGSDGLMYMSYTVTSPPGIGAVYAWITVGPDAVGASMKPLLIKFPLENIDLMREKILAAPKDVPFNAIPLQDFTSSDQVRAAMPYASVNCQMKYAKYVTTGITQSLQGLPGQTMQLGKLAGLLLKTYDVDRFNVWLNSEFVNDLTEAVMVSAAGGKVSINELNTAEKLYNIESRIAASNQTYKGWIQAIYGFSPNIAAEMPIYKGGIQFDIVFDEVISNSAAGEDQPLGTLAGRGVVSNFQGGNIHIETDEPAILMAIAHITPVIGYSEGNSWMTRLKTFDDLHKPEYDGIGYQPLLLDEMAAASTMKDLNSTNGELTPTYMSVGKQVAWSEYMSRVDRNLGDFADGEVSDYMVINRNYDFPKVDANSNLFENRMSAQMVQDRTTYIDPSKHNYPFANQRLDAMNFWMHIGIEETPYRIIGSKQIPKI